MTTGTLTRAAAWTGRGRRAWAGGGRLGRLGYGILGFALLIGVWYLTYLAGIVNRGLLPRPDEVARAAWSRFTEAGLLFDIRVSMTRVSIGVFIGSVAALPVGFLLAWYRPLRAMFDPLVSFFRALPPIALIPLVIVYFGIGEVARISILAYASFFAAVVVLYEGIAAIDPIYIKAARSLGANQFEIFTRCIIPLAVPQFFVAVRVALGVSWATLVAAELIAANRGLGAVIQNAGNFLQIPVIYVGIALIGVAALVMDYLLKLLMGRITRWQERTAR